EYLAKISALQESLEKAELESKQIEEQELLLGLQVTDFSLLEQTRDHLHPYEMLWNLYVNLQKQLQHWLKGYVFKLDAVQVENSVNHMLQTATQLTSTLADIASSNSSGTGRRSS